MQGSGTNGLVTEPNVHWRIRDQTYSKEFNVGINTITQWESTLHYPTPRTSKLGWRYFETNKIDRNKLQIRNNWQKGTGTKMIEKLNNFEKFEGRKNIKFQPYSQPEDIMMTDQML